MSPERFRIRDAVPGDEAAVRDIVFTTLREYGLTPDPQGTDADLQDLHVAYVQPGGVFRIITDDTGRLIGCGGFRPAGADTVELRKMYLARDQRGRGLGRRLLEELIAAARAAGHQRMVLDTASVLKEALALYEKRGFSPYDNPDRVRRCDRSLFLDLG